MHTSGNGHLREFGGSAYGEFNNDLVHAVFQSMWHPADRSPEGRDAAIKAMLNGMMGFKPANEVEGMIAAQAMAAHCAAMECSRRAMLANQPYECAQGFRKAAATASRTFIELTDALDRRRGKSGQQKVTVEHVHVHAGGKAIVGNVAAGA
eukprot:gene24405-31769_t